MSKKKVEEIVEEEQLEYSLKDAQEAGIELPKPYLSITVISSVEDKEKYLQRFLQNIPKSPEIELIFVETIKGKRCKTIMKQDEPLLKWYEWHYKDFSFSEARNYAKSLATGTWILSMDMDEILPAFLFDDMMLCLHELESSSFKGIRLGMTSSTTNIKEGKYDRIHIEAVKLFKNLPDIFWTGHIHTLVEFSMKPEEITDLAVSLYHTGYEITEQEWLEKSIRNIRYLGRDLYESQDEHEWHHWLYYMKRTIELLEASLDNKDN